MSRPVFRQRLKPRLTFCSNTNTVNISYSRTYNSYSDSRLWDISNSKPNCDLINGYV